MTAVLCFFRFLCGVSSLSFRVACRTLFLSLFLFSPSPIPPRLTSFLRHQSPEDVIAYNRIIRELNRSQEVPAYPVRLQVYGPK